MSAAGITSNTVPWEILRAAGYSPRLLDADDGPTPYADRYMEPVFDPRFRVIFDRLCSGAWNDLELVVLSRASEQEHKLYLYLREMARTHDSRVPKLYLYNLLHTHTPESRDYGLERTREMAREFGASEHALNDAIAESNRARAMVRQIQQKRQEGFLEGSVAIEMIRGFYAGDRPSFSHDALGRLTTLQAPLDNGRPRILLKGAPLNSAALHRVVENGGGYVLGEDDWRGSRAGGERDVRTDSDPIEAIFEKYFYDETSPRMQPAQERDAWFRRKVSSGVVDGVVFYIPTEDDVVGWDCPRQLAWLDQIQMPTLVLRNIGPSAELDAFLRGLPRR